MSAFLRQPTLLTLTQSVASPSRKWSGISSLRAIDLRQPTARARLKLIYYSSSAVARRCNAWGWLVVVFSAKQEQQLYHQQLINGSTILKTFTFPVNLDLFNLSTVSFGSILANILLS